MLANGWSRGVASAWLDVSGLGQRLLGAVAVLVVGGLVAMIVRVLVIRVLNTIDLDTVVDPAGPPALLKRSHVPDSVEMIGTVLAFSLIVMSVRTSIGMLREPRFPEIGAGLIAGFPRVLVAAAILIISGVVATGLRSVVAPVAGRPSLGAWAPTLVVLTVWMTGAFTAVDQLHVTRDVAETIVHAVFYVLVFVALDRCGAVGMVRAWSRRWEPVGGRGRSRTSAQGDR